MRLKTLLQSATAVIAIALATPSPVYAKDTTPVVATFSILGDLVREIGGKHIALTTLVGPDGDAHVYKPTPADARAVSGAKVLFVNGLDFEELSYFTKYFLILFMIIGRVELLSFLIIFKKFFFKN